MDRQEAKVWLELEGADVSEEAGKRVVCPFCAGGHNKEESFLLFRNSGQLKGFCYRAKCGMRIHSDKRRASISDTVKCKFNRRVYIGQVGIPKSKLVQLFADNYGIYPDDLGRERVRYDAECGRLVFPVFDRFGKEYGYNLKRTSNTTDDKPKWVTYFDRETSKLHYPLGYKKSNRYTAIVIVEDILSAIRVARLMPVVALQGTHMSWEQARELLEQTDKLIIALDPDKGGIKAAMRIKNRYRTVFKDGVHMRLLNSDPKEYKSDFTLEQHILMGD